jgi:hypothetical protein
MNRCIALAAGVLVGFAVAGPVQSDIIHESAIFQPVGRFTGPVLIPGFTPGTSGQWCGSRFSVTSGVDVASVGGNLYETSGTLFAAIISLSSPTALPSGNPVDMTPLATAVFGGPTPNQRRSCYYVWPQRVFIYGVAECIASAKSLLDEMSRLTTRCDTRFLKHEIAWPKTSLGNFSDGLGGILCSSASTNEGFCAVKIDGKIFPVTITKKPTW